MKFNKPDWILVGNYLTLLAVIFSIFSASVGLFEPPVISTEIDKNLETSTSLVKKSSLEVIALKKQLIELDKVVYGKDTMNINTSQIINRVVLLNIRVDSLGKKFNKIERLIIKDPDEVLSIPLIKKDIETIKLENDSKISNLTKDIERAYNIIFISLVSIAVAVIVPLISSIFQRRNINP